MSLYNCKSTKTGWRIIKWDDSFNIESIYELSGGHGRIRCLCPQSTKETCRHRVMLDAFLKYKTIDKNLFLDYDNNKWHRPVEEFEK